MVFASCNDPHRPQPLWKPILAQQPHVFIWGGDNIYADTEDLSKMRADYEKIWSEPDYQQLALETTIIGTWDDHDYGKNDAGIEWAHKVGAQKELLDFLNVPENDVRRTREGVYTSQTFESSEGSVKVILLDTRYFRTAINDSPIEGRRYDAWPAGSGGSVLGDTQWSWLENELDNDSADFTLVVSSIQLLSELHGWEKWGNHPEERARMLAMIAKAKAKNIIFLTGDRHMAEFSKDTIPGKTYPLIDFTTSGLTHTYINSPTEENPYRFSNVIKRLNFGVLRFDFEQRKVTFEIRGEDNFLYERHIQQY
jgi:alkaline phosphatase D